MSSSPAQISSRLREVDGLRVVVALSVMLFHYTTRYDEVFVHTAALAWGFAKGPTPQAWHSRPNPASRSRCFVKAAQSLFSAERPGKSKGAVELATLEWVARFNHRLLEPNCYIRPAEAEAKYFRHRSSGRRGGGLTHTKQPPRVLEWVTF